MNPLQAIRKLFGGDAAQALTEQQTASEARVGQIKREFAQHPSKGLTPARLYQILEAAEQGDLTAQHELFEDMEEKDAQIGADLGKRRQLAAELEWQIVPPDGASAQERKAADFATEVFSGLEVEDLVIDLGAGIGHGFAMLEIPWTADGTARRIEQPIFRPHRWFRLHAEDQDHITLRDNSPNGADLWPLGWVQHRHKAKPGYVARSGLHRLLAWPYLFKNYALGDLAELLEIYGLPARVGTYPRNATPTEKATLLRAVTSLGHSAGGIIPEGMAIEYKLAAAGQADPYEVMLNWCERAISRAILGGSLTSGTGEGTNTNALGNVHERGQASLIRADARQYAGTISRDILWPLALLNFGIEDRRRAPRFFLDTAESEDLQLLSESLPVFVGLGAQIPLWWLHEKTRIPQAAEGEAVLANVQAPAHLPGEAALAALRATPRPGDEPDGVDYVVEAALADWEPLLAPMVDPLQSLLDRAKAEGWTAQELIDHLPEVLRDMDAGPLAERLTQAAFAGRLAGNGDG